MKSIVNNDIKLDVFFDKVSFRVQTFMKFDSKVQGKVSIDSLEGVTESALERGYSFVMRRSWKRAMPGRMGNES